MAWPAPFSGWLLEAGRRLPVQMNDYPRQNPAYRLTYQYKSERYPLSIVKVLPLRDLSG